MSRPRDGQVSKFYNALACAMQEPLDELAVEKMARRVVKSAWWAKRVPTSAGAASCYYSAGAASCYYSAWINPGSKTVGIHSRRIGSDLQVLHALAHLLSPKNTALHGREFCRDLLAMTSRFLGADRARDLRANFSREGVKARVVNLSEEQKEKRSLAFLQRQNPNALGRLLTILTELEEE